MTYWHALVTGLTFGMTFVMIWVAMDWMTKRFMAKRRRREWEELHPALNWEDYH